MEVRPEASGDIDAIRGLTRDAFRDAPHSSQTEAAIVDALRDAGALMVSLVAVQHGDIVGHVAFSPVTINGEQRGWFGLGPVSVRPDRQRQGMGQALIRAGLERLRAMDAQGCVVLGEPAFYGRFGFASHPSLRYPGAPNAYFQRLALAGPPAEGDVTYHAGFDSAALP